MEIHGFGGNGIWIVIGLIVIAILYFVLGQTKKSPRKRNTITSNSAYASDDKVPLIKNIRNSAAKLEEMKALCYSKYAEIIYDYEKREAIKSAFAGDMGIREYIADFIDFCTDTLGEINNDANKIKLFAYNKFLFGIQLKLNNANAKIKEIHVLSKESYFEKYDLIDSPQNLSGLSMDKLNSLNRSLNASINRTDNMIEDLSDKQRYYNQDVSGKNNEKLFKLLEECRLTDYETVGDISEYKSKLIKLSNKLKEALK